jgi:hypothetical protein
MRDLDWSFYRLFKVGPTMIRSANERLLLLGLHRRHLQRSYNRKIK